MGQHEKAIHKIVINSSLVAEIGQQRQQFILIITVYSVPALSADIQKAHFMHTGCLRAPGRYVAGVAGIERCQAGHCFHAIPEIIKVQLLMFLIQNQLMMHIIQI